MSDMICGRRFDVPSAVATPDLSCSVTALKLFSSTCLRSKLMSISLAIGRTKYRSAPLALLHTRCMSSAPARPYYFHVGASWAGKPPEPRARTRKTALTGFPPDTDIGRWTHKSLGQFASAARGRQPGEDFFYVQEVRCAVCLSAKLF